jgi:hypothetical protein
MPVVVPVVALVLVPVVALVVAPVVLVPVVALVVAPVVLVPVVALVVIPVVVPVVVPFDDGLPFPPQAIQSKPIKIGTAIQANRRLAMFKRQPPFRIERA